MTNPKTLIIGASTNPDRYSYKASHALRSNGYDFIPFGVKKGVLIDKEIENTWNENWEADTVTLYINSNLQKEYYDAILALKPRRVIFNPGTENPDFYPLLTKAGIEFEEACTLVLLGTKTY